MLAISAWGVRQRLAGARPTASMPTGRVDQLGRSDRSTLGRAATIRMKRPRLRGGPSSTWRAMQISAREGLCRGRAAGQALGIDIIERRS